MAEPAPMPVVARYTKCGRGFVRLGDGDLIDHYPPPGWCPEGGWSTWGGVKDPRYPPPECGGKIEMLATGATQEGGRDGC